MNSFRAEQRDNVSRLRTECHHVLIYCFSHSNDIINITIYISNALWYKYERIKFQKNIDISSFSRKKRNTMRESEISSWKQMKDFILKITNKQKDNIDFFRFRFRYYNIFFIFFNLNFLMTMKGLKTDDVCYYSKLMLVCRYIY